MSANEKRLQGAGVDVRVLADLERVDRMTALALRRNLARMRIQMACDTRGSDPLEDRHVVMTGRDAGCGRLVTGDAHDGGVFARQRELRALVRERGHREVGGLHRVTRFASGAELTEVNITVTRGALFRGIHEANTDRTSAGCRRYWSERAAMALRTCQRHVLTLEEWSRPGVRERRYLERSCGMTVRAHRAQLAPVRVHVAGGAFRVKPTKIRTAPGHCDLRSNVDVSVAIDAGEHRVLVRQREPRGVVIERPPLKTGLAVARLTVLPESALMRILVAARAEFRFGPRFHRRHHMARDARDRGMQTFERERRACVIDFAGPPRLRDMARGTGSAERLAVLILMAGAARRERNAFERIRAMAGFARNRRMRPCQRKGRARMVEAALRVGKCDRRRVTGGALRAECPFVRIRVTRGT